MIQFLPIFSNTKSISTEQSKLYRRHLNTEKANFMLRMKASYCRVVWVILLPKFQKPLQINNSVLKICVLKGQFLYLKAMASTIII